MSPVKNFVTCTWTHEQHERPSFRNMKHTRDATSPCRKSGFATYEIFIVSPIILAIGIGVTLLVRWLSDTTHWATFLPAALAAIPFLATYGLLLPMICLGELLHKKRRMVSQDERS